MTQTLAANGHDVHMLVLGENKADRGDVTCTELTGDLPQATEERLTNQRFLIDEASTKINGHMEQLSRSRENSRLGGTDLPSGRDSFDYVVGFGDVTGRSALWIRDNIYKDAKVANIITMDPKGLFKTVGPELQDLGEYRTELHRQVFGASDLVLAHGPKSAEDSRALMSELEGARSVTPVHEFVPGMRVSPAGNEPPGPGEDLNLLMLGRMNDPNKGAADVARAVEHLREHHDVTDIQVTLRGVPDQELERFHDYMDAHAGENWRDHVTVKPFSSSESDKQASVRNTHAMIMATESEAWGLAASEVAAQGKPVIVAEGNGHGYATFLQDTDRFPESDGRSDQPTVFAETHVMNDDGTRSALGTDIGEGSGPRTNRHEVIAGRLLHLRDNYEQYARSAESLQHELSRYTPEHMAESLDQAARARLEGTLEHTKQVADGQNIRPSPERITKGVSEDKHEVVTRVGEPTQMKDRSTHPPQAQHGFLSSGQARSVSGTSTYSKTGASPAKHRSGGRSDSHSSGAGPRRP